jgi:hypothetical protein
MSRKLLASILIASSVVILLAVALVVVVVRPEPAPPKPVPTIGSIRDLKPVTLPATSPESQPPKSDASKDDASAHQN